MIRNQKELVLNLCQNQQLVSELYRSIIRKFKKRKVYSSFKDNIWGVDQVERQLIRKYNKGIRCLLCAIDLFSKYDFDVPLKNKNATTIANAFKQFKKKAI